MSTVEALKAARAAGVELALDGDNLALRAASAPSAAVLDALSRHKAEIVALLRPAEHGWSSEDWQVFFDERAGIAEFDGGLPRAEAEAQAFVCCVVEWLNSNPLRSRPGCCVSCGRRDHGECEGKNAEALVALVAMGIAVPADFPNDLGKNGGA